MLQINPSYEKVRTRCRKGIPHSLRAAAWRALCGAANLQQKNPGIFEVGTIGSSIGGSVTLTLVSGSKVYAFLISKILIFRYL